MRIRQAVAEGFSDRSRTFTFPAKPNGDGPLRVIELAAVIALSGAGLTYARSMAG